MTDYYIDPNADAGGDGTTTGLTGGTCAFDSWAAAKTATAFVAGNTIMQNRGTTSIEASALDLGANGTLGNEIVLDAYGTGANPIIQGASGEYAFFCNARRFHIINNIDIIGDNEHAVYIFSSFGPAHDITFNNCNFSVINAVIQNNITQLLRSSTHDLYSIHFTSCSYSTDLTTTVDHNACRIASTAQTATSNEIYDLKWDTCVFSGNLTGPRFIDSAWNSTEWDWHISNDNRPYGIVIENCNFNDVIGVSVKYALGTKDAVGYESYFHNNTVTAAGSATTPSINAVQTHYNTGLRISNNTIAGVFTSSPDGHAIILDQMDAYGITYPTQDCKIYANRLSGCRDGVTTSGVSAFFAINNDIYSNIITNCSGGVMVVHEGCTGNNVIGNTIDNCDYGIILSDYPLNAEGPDVVEKNNIITNCLIAGLHSINGADIDDHINTYNLFFSNTLDTDNGAIDASSIEADPLLDSSYAPTSSSPCVATGTKWWTGPNPAGYDGEPLMDFYTDIGAIQSKHSPFHPRNL